MRRALLGVALTVAFATPTLSAESSKTFTVRDSIEMRRVVRIDGPMSWSPSDVFVSHSPDQNRFVARTIRGDVERDENVEQLLLWDTSSVLELLSRDAAAAPATPRTLTELRYKDDWAAMSDIAWLSDTEIGFIAPAPIDGRMQAFAVDITSGRQLQLTHSQTDVVSFAAAGDRVVYRAKRPIPPERQRVRTYDGGLVASWLDVTGQADVAPLEMFTSSGTSEPTQRVDAPAVTVANDRLWISPRGDYAIALTAAANAPEHWQDYRVWDNARRGWTRDWLNADPSSADLYGRMRYQLIDLETGRSRDLFDAPDGSLTFAPTPHEVFWLDERHVVASHTYLPLTGVGARERRRRALAPAIAEIDVQTGAATAIVWEPYATLEQQKAGQRSDFIVGAEWSAQRRILSVTTRLKDGTQKSEHYARRGRSWSKAVDRKAEDSAGLTIVREESLAQRPKLYAIGQHCRCKRQLFDPAPQLEDFTFGAPEEFAWKDAKGTAWKGALIYPVGYRKDHRYPFVLQTHGYSPREFLVDGPAGVTTAFAAQALANAGFVVLQAAESSAAITVDPEEGPNVARGWKAAIDELVARGLIDERKVGIIGWSRTGYHLAAMLAEHPDAVAAATLADSVQYSYTQYLFSGTDKLFADEVERVIGALPSKIGDAQWLERSLVYRMSRAKTALRVEAIGPASLVAMWESFRVHSAAGRPADFVYFPNGSHVLQKPSERSGSQGGTVDWFRFWLQDYEDRDPSKTVQYTRWRKLRALQTR